MADTSQEPSVALTVEEVKQQIVTCVLAIVSDNGGDPDAYDGDETGR